MSSPGGPGNWGQYHHGSEQYYDPITGQPINPNTPAGYTGYPTGQKHPEEQPHPPGSSGTQYQGFGVFEQTRPQQPRPSIVTGYPQPEPAHKNRAPLIAGIVAAAVMVVAIVVTTTIVVAGDGDGSGNMAAPATSTTTTREALPPTAPTPSAPLSATAPASKTENVRKPVAPVVDGWQGMALLEFGIAYDIPPGWEPETGSLSGFEDGSEKVTMSGYSSYKRDFCPEEDLSFRARVGLTGSDSPDPATAANNAFRKWARMGWGTAAGELPRLTRNPAKSVTLDGGRVDATIFSGTIIPAEPGPCSPPSVFVSILAIGGNDGSDAALMIGIADQGVPGAVPPADINRSLTSVRWLD
ncbi:hypothetical protein [Haloactinomyces albus]|uniref:DUF8017 domain-containing protein n=1 Tax=Haloactinomyces albus TaxID=1352928 RepID=A0AAE4CKA7_9ACTN|nr:hypothetical protein [Haloactinomyces albus]MDR7300549.1 hypothetical protein [Haloactinomyces albus]